MKVTETTLPGVLLIEPEMFTDSRGFLLETYSLARYLDAGVGEVKAQDNFVRSGHRVLRGLHYQQPGGQGKLIQVFGGVIFDVCVDVRRGSPTFGKWYGVELSEGEHRQVWIPPGYAHGFCVLSETADVYYKMSTRWVAEDEHAILWSDPAIG